MIQIDQLSKHYRQGKTVVRALDEVSLTIDSGEFVAIVGRSGSGKTTMLDSLGLLLRPTSGRVIIDGTDTSGLKDDQKARLRGSKIGFIFQEYNLLPTLTALENVMLPLRYASKPKGDRAWAQALLAEVGLEDRMHSRPDQMSGGQQQRVAIARSLVNRPSLVLGDEPTGAVDTETAQQLAGIMRRLNRQHQVTFVIVTHDLDLAAETDRVIKLKDGKVISDETTAPASVAV
ncbi:MAG TPA: ABC transporter ATP-binding protein [Candidatus Dormibacteraeota bacterium]|nr:ABC transporter ATP-binding protein [Candidatus Dormibacteraeota bacterium]